MNGTWYLHRVLLLLGCGSMLTLLSGFYSRSSPGMFLDVAPTEYESRQFGFPFPIYSSYAAWYATQGWFSYDATFVWAGALLDVLLYSAIAWVGYGLIVNHWKRKEVS